MVKITAEKRIELVKKALLGESVSKICRENNLSRVIFYRWLARYKEEGEKGLETKASGRPKETKTLHLNGSSYTKLSPTARLLMVKEVVEQKQNATEVSKRYGISRITLYKWIKRYEEDLRLGKVPEMKPKVPFVEHYYHETPEKYQDAVLAMIAKHPEYGIRSIVANLPKIGTTPLVGHHGVQNILKRNGLLHFEDRLAYAKARETPVTSGIRKILEPMFNFFKISSDTRYRIIESWTTVALSAIGIIVILGAGTFLAGNVFSAVGVSKIGLIFACVALVMGSVFFLYSLKYYLTLAIVLSYSQKSSLDKNQINSTGNLMTKILGMTKSNSIKRGQIASGLEPDLSHVVLKRKPYISVHIPFYNEKNVVRRSIEAAINFKYPEYEVILCDDSTDATTDIIREYMKLYLTHGEKLEEIKNESEGWSLASVEVKPGVTLKHLHRTTRTGYKGKALELALKLVNPKTEFISIFDADFVPYPDSLELFLKYLKVENKMSEDYRGMNVAAVQGYQWHVLNKSENWITRGVRSEYAGSYVIERSGAEIYGGLKQISGSVYMIRRDVLQEIGWGESITEDFELTLKLYNAGYKVLYTPYIQAPAECVSTLKRLVRQRMRWAEGHSYNIKKMFGKLITSPKLSFFEKLELVYLSPYYLQAFFFLVGTFAWLLSESIFRVHLPFWTQLWGWSLVLTNMFALPLVNGVGLFMEESGERDYMGLGSFIALSYILVPFQAYASVKGLLEDREGPWFRTPKTGRITDIFSRGRFYKFIAGILPGRVVAENDAFYTPSPYLALSSANNQFNSFDIKPIRIKWAAKAVISILLCFTTTLLYFAKNIDVVYATNISGTMAFKPGHFNTTGESWPSYGNGLQNGATLGTTPSLFFFNNTANINSSRYYFFSNLLPISTNGTAIIPGGNYYVNLAKTSGPANANTINYAIQLLLTNNNGSSPNVILSNNGFWTRNNSGTEYGSPISGASGAHNTIFAHLIGNLSGNISINGSAQQRLAVRIFVTKVTSASRTSMNWIINNSGLPAQLVLPSPIQVPEIPQKVIFIVLVSIMPIIPSIASKMSEDKRKKKKNDKKGGGWGNDFRYFVYHLTGVKEVSLDELPV